MVFLVLILSSLLGFQIKRYKLYKSSIALLYWCSINIFLFPAIYYSFLDGESYKSFSDESYRIYLTIGSFYLFELIVFNRIFMYMTKRHIHKLSFLKTKVVSLSELYSTLTVFGFLIFIIMFRDKLPLAVTIFQGKAIGDLGRPDVSGSIPHYFTVSTFFSVTIPMLYFYYQEIKRWNTFWSSLFLIPVLISFLIGGNKGLAVYFFLFIWIYIWKLKFNIRTLSKVFIFSGFMFYIREFLLYGGIDISKSWIELLSSPFRRFFVTQGAMLINRIEMINSRLLDSESVLTSGTTISRIVYQYVYQVSGGSAPTFYLGDLVVTYGMFLGVLISSIVLVILYQIAIYIDRFYSKDLYVKWGFFYILFLLGMTGISLSFWIRWAVVCFSLFVLSFDKVAEKKQQNCYMSYEKSC